MDRKEERDIALQTAQARDAQLYDAGRFRRSKWKKNAWIVSGVKLLRAALMDFWVNPY